MDDEALIRIERELQQIADALGEPEALDDRFYRRRSTDGAPESGLPIRDRLREKILALDRLMALHDRSTYQRAIRNIHEATKQFDSAIPHAAVVLNDDVGSDIMDLSDFPDLTTERTSLRSLLQDLEIG